jgi:hypothetical protein
MKLAKFMALPKFMNKKMWLVVLFIVLVIILFMRSNMTDGFVVQDLPPDQALNQQLTWPPGPIWANISQDMGYSSGNNPVVFTCPPELVNIPHPNNSIPTFNPRRLPNGEKFMQCLNEPPVNNQVKPSPYWKTYIVYNARLTPPTPLKYTVGNGSITISWDTPPGDLPVNAYLIRAREGVTYKDEGKSAGSLNGNAKSRSATIRNLKNGVSYYITVTAVAKGGSELFQYLPLKDIIPKA